MKPLSPVISSWPVVRCDVVRCRGTRALIRSGKCWIRECHEECQDVCHQDIRTSVILIMWSAPRNHFKKPACSFSHYLLDARQQLLRGLFMFLCLITATRISISSQRFCKSLGVEAWQLCTVLVVVRIEINRAGWINKICIFQHSTENLWSENNQDTKPRQI